MTGRLAYHFYHLFWTGLDWFYPPSCGGCERRGERWCHDCQQSVTLIQNPICPCCGQSQPEAKICTRCAKTKSHYVALRSWAVFGGKIRNALHRLKYQRDIGLGEALSMPLATYLRELQWPIDMIVPVPLGNARLAERGYNQAELLARPVALACAIPLKTKALLRAKETRSQVGLSAVLRRQNVAGAFEAKSSLVKEKNVLVMDDVTTSGATLDACAAALLEAGAHAVYGLTLARAVLSSTDGST